MHTTLRVLIWAKTYPELSARHAETVRTGGLREDGTPVRLYPVPLRYLGTDQQYSLYDWIDVPAERNLSDPRPESFKVIGDEIRHVGHVGTEHGAWRTRLALVTKDSTWQFDSVGALKRAQADSGRSFGLVTPGAVDAVHLRRRPDSERAAHEAKLAAIQSQADFFRPEYKDLEFPDHDIILHWRCRERCSECRNGPHKMKVMDWGLLQLARKQGWSAAKTHLESLSDLATHDVRLFLGNFRLRLKTFGIIGLWYPKRRAQLDLL